MLRFHADKFLDSLYQVTSVRAIFAGLKEKHKGKLVPEKIKEDLSRRVESLRNQLQEMSLRMSVKACDRLLDKLKEDVVVDDPQLDYLMRDTYSRIRDELEGRLLLSVSPEKGSFYEPVEPLFGAQVQDSFASASNEIDEAGKCFALGRYTACVFHLMRVLEVGLNSLASVLDVKFEHTNWQNIIDAIEKKIAENSKNKGDGWREKEKFYSEAAAHFMYLKNAWRNHTMHVRESYDEERALTVFNNVKGFMQVLAANGLVDIFT